MLNIAARSGSCHQATRGRGGGEIKMQRFIMDCRMTIRQAMKQILRPKGKSKSKVKGQHAELGTRKGHHEETKGQGPERRANARATLIGGESMQEGKGRSNGQM